MMTGTIISSILVATIASYPICRLLLFLYKRSVRRSMMSASSAGELRPAARIDCAPPARALTEVEVDAQARGGALYAQPWKTAAVYAAAGAMFAVVFAIAKQLSMDDEPSWFRTLVLFWVHYWPAVLSVNLVLGPTRRRALVIAAYFAVLAVMTAVMLARNPGTHWYNTLALWLLLTAVPMLVASVYLSRRVRAIGPLVFLFVLVAVMGGQVLFSLVLVTNENAFYRLVVKVAMWFRLDGIQAFWVVMLMATIAFTVVAWYALRWIAGRYEWKRFSDEMLNIDAIWIGFAFSESISLAYKGRPFLLTGLIAFAVYKATTYLGFAAIRPTARPRSLLLLRVFSLGKRSERLFDMLRAHWLRIGNILMIAGPDLITRTIEPHELLRFVSGRMAREFVASEADLEKRLAHLDTAPDPDGRYRVDEFFCRADTWQPVMRALASRSDAVLMDLRGFTQANRGCLFELGEVLNLVELARLVLVVDARTDRAFLSASLQERWSGLAEGSINRGNADPALRIVTMPRVPTTNAIRQLLAQLYADDGADARASTADGLTVFRGTSPINQAPGRRV